MPDRPILFSSPLVRALLSGTKTQTRRVLPNPEYYGCPTGDCPHDKQAECNAAMQENAVPDVRFAVGDRLYVREEYYHYGRWQPLLGVKTKGGQQKWTFTGVDKMVTFEQPAEFLTSRSKAFPGLDRWYKRLGRFMPRSYSRLTLTVTDVRVERLQDISEADAIAEGIYCTSLGLGGLYSIDRPGDRARGGATIARPAGWEKASHAYCYLWERINGKGSWDANPWVVAVSFDVQQGNIDA